MTRRIVKVVPYPDRVIKRVNGLGKTPRGEKYSDGLEFLNRHKQRFDWENEELNEKISEVEEPIYPDILAEVPGLVLESDFDDADDVVMTPPQPTLEEQAERALDNMGMTADPTDDGQITGVHGQIPGVHRQITGVDNTPLRVTPDTDSDAHVVRGITPPRLIRPPVQVEDVTFYVFYLYRWTNRI